MANTLEKVMKAGQSNPGNIPTKIYAHKGLKKNNIVALEPVEVINERYSEAANGGNPMIQFTDYRGNPSFIHWENIEGFSSLCSEAQYVSAQMGIGMGAKQVPNMGPQALPQGAEQMMGLLGQMAQQMGLMPAPGGQAIPTEAPKVIEAGEPE